MRVLTNMASAVLGSILLVGTIGIANADKDSSEDSKKISVTKNSSNDHNDDESDGGVNNPPSTGNNGGGSKGSGGSKGNGGGTSNPPSAGGTTGTTKNPAADPIQTTAPNCLASKDITIDPVIEGRRAFMRLNCYSCHIANGHSAGMGPSLIGKANEMDAVSSGEDGGMPSFKNNLCKNDIANLSAYIATLGKTSNGKPLEPTFTHWWMPGLPEK